MYFPYIRGRQYELLALKELVSRNLICDRVVPIVEPVKLTSTLINTISEFTKANRIICIIRNPGVGNFTSECKRVQSESKEEIWCNSFKSQCSSGLVISALLMNIDTGSSLQGKNANDFLVIHNDPDFIEDYEKLFDTTTPVPIPISDVSLSKITLPTLFILEIPTTLLLTFSITSIVPASALLIVVPIFSITTLFR